MLYIWREYLVVSGLHLMLMSAGISLSLPSILAPALYSNQTDIQVTPEDINIIMGGFGMYTTFLFLLFPTVMQLYGRKTTNILFSVFMITGSICVALATDVPTLVAGRFIQNIPLGSYYLSSLIASEYVHPKRRGIHLVLKGMFSGFGELACHGLGLTILTYRHIAWITVVLSILSILITTQWPESPSFLAYKGRYKECTKAFEWIRGTDHEAKKELQELILFQQEGRKQDASTSITTRTLKAFRKKDFLKPLFISLLLCFLFQSTGALVLIMYISEIITRIAGNRSVAFWYTIGLDMFRALSHIFGSCVVRFVKRRVVLFSACSVSCSIMGLLIILYYLDKINVINVKWLNPIILVLYYIILSVFVIPVTMVTQGEILPLKFKGLGGCIVGFAMCITSATIMQYSWVMINTLDIHGVFGILLVCEVVFLVLIYIFMPDTTDRTLQDIENDFVKLNVTYEEVEISVTDKLNKKIVNERS